MNPHELFPLGLAAGKVFCNRDKERAQLKQYLATNHHAIIISPRRYGKTSLVFQVLREMNRRQWVGGNLDFLIASDAIFIQEKILQCVGKIIPQLLPVHKKALAAVKKLITSAVPSLVISESGVKIEFNFSQKPQDTIIEALLALDKIAQQEKKQVVLLFDEFQQISAIQDSKVIEASIRHAAERAKSTRYIFSGSHRNLLMALFDDSARPLYHLCEKLVLDRISAEDYSKHLQACSKIRWRSSLNNAVIDKILILTRRHSYYTNLLCSRLWESEHPPSTECVLAHWQRYVNQEEGRITHDIARLSANQRAVLKVVATESVSQPASKKFLNQTHLPAASAAQAVRVMLDNDVLYKDEAGILRVLDPSVEFYLSKIK